MSFGFELEVEGFKLSFGDGLQELWKFSPGALSAPWSSPSPYQYPVKNFPGRHHKMIDGQRIIFTSYSVSELARQFLEIKNLILPNDYYGVVLDRLEFPTPGHSQPIWVDLSYDGGHLEFRTSASLQSHFFATSECKVFTRNLVNQTTRIEEMCSDLYGSGNSGNSNKYTPTTLLSIIYVPCVDAINTSFHLQKMVQEFDFSTQTINEFIKEVGYVNSAWSNMIKSIPISVYVENCNLKDYYLQTNGSIPLSCFGGRGFLVKKPLFSELIEKDIEATMPVFGNNQTELQIFNQILSNDLPQALNSAGWANMIDDPNCAKFIGMVGLIFYYFQFLFAQNLSSVTAKDRFPLLLKSHFHQIMMSFTRQEMEFWQKTPDSRNRFSKMIVGFLAKILGLNANEAEAMPTFYFTDIEKGSSRVVYMGEILEYLSHLFECFSRYGNFEYLKTTGIWKRAQDLDFYNPAEHPIEFEDRTPILTWDPVFECRRHRVFSSIQDFMGAMPEIARCWEGFYR